MGYYSIFPGIWNRDSGIRVKKTMPGFRKKELQNLHGKISVIQYTYHTEQYDVYGIFL